MSDTRLDDIVRDVLHEHADTQAFSPHPPSAVIRRTRRRLLRNGALATIALILLTALTVRALPWGAHSVPVNRPTAPVPKGDGKIAFSAGRSLYVIAADGGKPSRIAGGCRADSCDGIDNVAWSPDGRQLIFGYWGRPPDWSLFVVGQDGGKVRALTFCRYPSCGEDDFPSWSPDGSKIAFVRTGEKHGLYVMDRQGSNLTRLSSGIGGGRPSWSPDGTRIAHTVEDSTMRTRIEVVKTDGTGGFDLVSGNDPTWSPDGREIAYLTGSSTGSSQVRLIGADGSNPRLLYDAPKVFDLSWSPDGTRLAVEANGSLLVMNADGTGRSVLGPIGLEALQVGGPDWSPNGTQIAFWRDDRLIVVNADGGGERTVTRVPRVRPGEIAWQPVAP